MEFGCGWKSGRFVACPFFLPLRRLGPGDWDPAPRLTLGDAWGGTCHLDSHEPLEEIQREWCNRGYARRDCAHFPKDAAPDAVRFAWNANHQLIYILEKDHTPLKHGVFKVDAAAEPLRSQARAFVECWPQGSR